MFRLNKRHAFFRGEIAFVFTIRHNSRKTNFPNMTRQRDIHPIATGNQNDLVFRKGFTDFQASEKMTDTPDVLIVVEDFH